MSATVRIGTSGWVYRHWKGRFYPPGLASSRWLEFYATHFSTVEVNFSFNRLPGAETFAGWRAQTPPGFCFAVKGSRLITHLKRLKDPSSHVATFFAHAEALGEKLGPVLWQLPPRFRRDDERLEAFLAALPADRRQAIEFREASWFVEPVYALLARHGVALCIADSGGVTAPPEPRLTTGWTYLRFHSGLADGNYTEAQLRHWAGVVAGFRDAGVAVYAYFNNDWEGFAVENARRLQALLE